MSAHSSDLSSVAQTFVPLAVLAASLAGSGHCVSMCGGLLLAMAPDRSSLVRYHLGRGVSYALFGAMAGATGASLLSPTLLAVPGWLSWMATAAMALSLILLGLRLASGRAPHLPLSRPLRQVYERMLSRVGIGRSAFLTGLLTPLLPCGWLHGFVLGAMATRSPGLGAAFMALFWLGTLPALSFASTLVSKILQPCGQRAPRLSAALLIAAGLMTLGFKVSPLILHAACAHCH